ncbi:MAG: hypothetical protein J5I94_12170, partial [Phaeodactylibacter sp.]|nr:hypothetical protein [Phaeodactylibacter sp.]
MKKLFSKKAKRRLCLFLSFLILFYTTACNYFKVKTAGPDSLVELGELQKKFVVYQQLGAGWGPAYILSEPELSETLLEGKLAFADKDTIFDIRWEVTDPYAPHGAYKADTIVSYAPPFYYRPGRPRRYKSKEKPILSEVHIYVSGTAITEGWASIPLKNIREILIIEPDTGRTVASYLFTGVGIIAGAFAILLIILALTKTSCPYIYTYDGEGYLFQGEIYGGAIQRNLERHDFLPLPFLQPVDGAYRLRLSNELKERQYTNLAELVVVNHPEGSAVLLDSRGRPQLFSNPIPPQQALSEGGADLSAVLQAADRSAFLFNEPEPETKAVHLSFPKPEGARTARLLLNAKNTLWLDYLFGEFSQKFGSFHDTWIERQAQLPPEVRWQQTIDQQFPLSIYLNTRNGWELVEHLPTVGPLAPRDLAIPIDLSKVSGDKVELRLQTGFFFWEVDYAAMDYTDPQALDIQRVAATLAVDQEGNDHRAELAADDERYLAQPEPGMVAELRFPAVPVPEGKEQSVFLHAKGYYEHVRDYRGIPDFSELRKFRAPGHFS